jgi:hypothetical protein
LHEADTVAHPVALQRKEKLAANGTEGAARFGGAIPAVNSPPSLSFYGENRTISRVFTLRLTPAVLSDGHSS